jgi:hypothetical protein
VGAAVDPKAAASATAAEKIFISVSQKGRA